MFGADTHGGRDRAISVKKFEGPSVFGESCAREPQDSPRRSTALVIARAVTSSYHEGEAGHAVHPGRVPVRGGTGRRGRPSPVAEAAPIAGGKMIAGHFGFAAAVKSRETAAPLWALMLATVSLDVVFVPLFLTPRRDDQGGERPARRIRRRRNLRGLHAFPRGRRSAIRPPGPWRLGPMGAAQTDHRRRGLLPLAPRPCRPP